MLTATPQTIAILQENQRRLDELSGSTGASPAADPAAQVGSKNWNDHRRSIPPRDPEAPNPPEREQMSPAFTPAQRGGGGGAGGGNVIMHVNVNADPAKVAQEFLNKAKAPMQKAQAHLQRNLGEAATKAKLDQMFSISPH